MYGVELSSYKELYDSRELELLEMEEKYEEDNEWMEIVEEVRWATNNTKEAKVGGVGFIILIEIIKAGRKEKLPK